MPLYEYQCESCQKVTERIQKFSDPLMEICPSCGGPVKKLFSSPAIQFKGSGFYITDYARKSSDGKTGTETSGKTESSEKSAKSETADKGDKGGKSEKSDSSSSSGSTETKPATSTKND